MIAKLLRKVLYVGAFAYIIGNFNWLSGIVFRSFAGLGITATGSAITMENFLQPGRLAKTGIDAAAPILDQIGDMAGFPEVFANLDPIVVLFIARLVVILCFFVLAVQLFITLIEFKLTTLAGFVLIPFALWNKTSFLAEKVLGNVVSSGIKVLVLAVIVGIGSGLFAEFGASRRTFHRPRAGRDAGLARAAGAGHLRPWHRHRPRVRCAAAWRGRDGWRCRRRGRHGCCHRCRRDRRGRCRHGGRTHGPGRRQAGRQRRTRRHVGGQQRQVGIPAGSAAAGGGAKGAAAGLGNVAKTGAQAAGRRAASGVSAAGQKVAGSFRAGWNGADAGTAGSSRRCRRRRGQRCQRAEAGATRLGQADAPPPADHPCRDHRRPHAARWRRWQLGARPSLRPDE